MNKKIFALILIALLFVLIYISDTSQSNVLGLNITVNNTNLAPNAGPPHPFGTGERISNVTYWANESDIELFVFAHASLVSQTAEIHLSINGTIVADTSGRPLGGAEESNKTIIAIIPRYSNYSVDFINIHHYEWREYKILSGNVTTNITGSGQGCTGNCSFDGIGVNSIRKNNTSDAYGTYINLSSPFRKYNAIGDIFSHMSINDGSYYNLRSQNATSGNYSDIIGTPEGLTLSVTDGVSNNWNMYQDHTRYLIDTREYILNQSELNLGNANIRDVNETNRVLRLNETKRAAYTNKVDAYIYPNGTEATSAKTNDELFDHLFTSTNTNTVHNFVSFVNINTTGWNYFLAKPANGRYYPNNNTAYPENLTADKVMFRIASSGWNGVSWAGSAGIIDITSAGNWNSTSTPAKIDLFTTNISGSATKRVTVWHNGTVRIYNLAGAGNAYTCVDSEGTLYRGAPGC